MIATSLEIARADLARTRWVEQALPEDLPPGGVLLQIESFGLSANNITYGVLGEAYQYWQHFPATEAAWGRIPVWGFARVLASAQPQIQPGERVYGFLPMATHLVVQADQVRSGGFVDASAHRAGLPAAYLGFRRCATDPDYRPELEGLIAIMRPLALTAFLLDDALAARSGELTRVLMSSASSKTALLSARLMRQRPDPRARVIGMTAAARVDEVRKLGAYDEVLAYESLAELEPDVPTAFLDFAGRRELLQAVHTHLADGLRLSWQIGLTHWQAARGQREALPGVKPEVFFAPGHYAQRLKEWGAATLQSRMAAAWAEVAQWSQAWMEIDTRQGPAAIAAAYLDVLRGQGEAGRGLLLRW